MSHLHFFFSVFKLESTHLRVDYTKKRWTDYGRSKNALEANLYKNTASVNFLAVFTCIILFPILQQQIRKNVVSSKAPFLLNWLLQLEVTLTSGETSHLELKSRHYFNFYSMCDQKPTETASRSEREVPDRCTVP